VYTPRVLGVDEFALRQGCTYATILVDLVTEQLNRTSRRQIQTNEFLSTSKFLDVPPEFFRCL